MASRSVESQPDLFRRLEEGFRWVNGQVPAAQSLQSTVGDELQGVYGRLDEALRAALLLRLYLSPHHDLRVGIGWGEVLPTAPDRVPLAQTGAGWWLAREAIEEVARLVKTHGWPRTLRTRIRGVEEPVGSALNAVVILQDHLLAGMDAKDARIALGLFRGERQREMADELGISQSEVSRRQLENGPASLLRAHGMFQELEA